MSLPNSIEDRTYKRFRDAGSGLTKVAVGLEGDTGLLEGVQYDEIQATYPTTSTELYTFYSATVQVAQIEVTYSNPSKATFVSAKRV